MEISQGEKLDWADWIPIAVGVSLFDTGKTCAPILLGTQIEYHPPRRLLAMKSPIQRLELSFGLPFFAAICFVCGPVWAQNAETKKPEASFLEKNMIWTSENDVLVGRFENAPESQPIKLPRIYNSLGETTLIVGDERLPVTVQPELDHWILSWKGESIDWKRASLRLQLNGAVQKTPKRLAPSVDGSYQLDANQAQTSGTKLRFEPQSYKNTVGYWVDSNDFAWWDLELPKAGKFNLEILQGCGAGQGGSLVEIRFIELPAKASDSTLSKVQNNETPGQLIASTEFEVEETGHFQNFRWRHLGEVELKAESAIRLEIRVKKIAKNAVMDVRQIMLVRLP